MKVMDSSASSIFFSDEMAWPPGFRFHPTDEELVLYYLKRKICGRRIRLNVIGVTDVHKWEPEDLPGQSILKTADRQWFFFSPRDKKYPNGGRSNRATIYGYWKATGKDRNVNYNSRTVGTKKTLVFYRGRAPTGQRTDWVMHEYTINEKELRSFQTKMDYYALYKLYKKSGPGPKNGEHYGAPFKEEEWADDSYLDINNKHPEKVTALKILPDVDVLRVDNHPLLLSNTIVDVDDAVGLAKAAPQIVNEEVTQSSYITGAEVAEVTSAPDIFLREQCHLIDEDFLEIDDLVGHKIGIPNFEKPENLFSFEDGMSEFDLYHDAALFIQEMGPCIANQSSYEVSPHVYNDPPFTDYDQNHKCLLDDTPLPITGLPPCEDEEQNGGGDANNWLSSSLWSFVESIPTTPASASENRFVKRMSSFSRLKISAGGGNGSSKCNEVRDFGGRHYRSKRGLLYFSFLGAAFAILWILIK